MSDNIDQTPADSALASEPVDRAAELTMCKIRGVTHITLEGELSDFLRSFGSREPDFLFGLVHQVGNAGSNGEGPDERGIKFMLAFIKSRKPRDEIDAALLAQMGATHVAAMRFAHRLAHAESLQEQDSAERTFNKLMRTFAGLVEARQRYCAATEEVLGQHAWVSDDSQPSVANGVNGHAHETALKKPARRRPVLVDTRQSPGRSVANPSVRRFRRGAGKKG